MNVVRIVIADDHTIVRGGIRLLLESLEGVQVVAEAADGHEALELVRKHQPDVLVADIAMPGLNGLDLVRRMGEESLPTQAVILSMHTDQEYVHRAIAAGAKGYVLKESGIEELGMAIQSVFRGEIYLSPAITRPIVECYLDPRGSRAIPGGELTPRQREVLRLIAEGGTTKAVANQLGISAKTVEAHRSQLMERLQIYDVAGLVRYAIRTGLISSDP